MAREAKGGLFKCILLSLYLLQLSFEYFLCSLQRDELASALDVDLEEKDDDNEDDEDDAEFRLHRCARLH